MNFRLSSFIIHLSTFLLCAAPAAAQYEAVRQGTTTADLFKSFNLPSGKTIHIESGASLIADSGSTITGFSSALTVGTSTITGATNGYALYNNNGILGNLNLAAIYAALSHTHVSSAITDSVTASAVGNAGKLLKLDGSGYLGAIVTSDTTVGTTFTALSNVNGGTAIYGETNHASSNAAGYFEANSGGAALIAGNSPAVTTIDSSGNTIIGGGTTASELRLLEPSAGGSSYTGFKSPALAGNVIYTLPTADSAGVWTSNGSGTLSYTGTTTTGGPSGANKIPVYNADGSLVMNGNLGTNIAMLNLSTPGGVGVTNNWALEVTHGGSSSTGINMHSLSGVSMRIDHVDSAGDVILIELLDGYGILINNNSGDAKFSVDELGDVNIGHASDTTFARVSAGVASIEGATIYTQGGALGTPASGNASNLTGFPTSGLSGLGTGVATALAINTGTAGSFLVGPTNSAGVLTNNGSGTLSYTATTAVGGTANPSEIPILDSSGCLTVQNATAGIGAGNFSTNTNLAYALQITNGGTTSQGINIATSGTGTSINIDHESDTGDVFVANLLDGFGLNINSLFTVDELGQVVSDKIATTDSVIIDGSNAADIQLRIQGATSQSADYIVAEDSGGTDLFKVSSTGAITATSLTGTAGLNVLAATGNNAILGNQNDSGGGYTQIRCSTGNLYFTHASYGNSMVLNASYFESNVPIVLSIPQALSGAGAVDTSHSVTKYTSTGVAQALTLANGTDGQTKIIIHDVVGGSGVLTPTTKTGFSTLTFTNAGDTATLMYATTIGWVILSVNGTVVTP